MPKRTAYFVAAVAAAIVAAVALAAFLLWPSPGRVAALAVQYPLDGALFPADIAACRFRWSDGSGAEAWRIAIDFADGQPPMEFDSARPVWKPSRQQWEAVKRRSRERTATVTIRGAASGKAVSAGRVRIRTSRDEVGAPIFYREVNLPFREAVKDPSHIRWRFGPVSSEAAPPVVLEKLPTCANCHSFSLDGSTLAMEVDSANDKGSYAIAPIEKQMVLDPPKIITWSDYRREDDQPTFGLLAQISPDAGHVLCMVKDRSVFSAKPGLAFSQLFFPIRGILVYYRRRTRSYHALPGADDPRLVQANPTWSPDGKTILFARTRAYDLKKRAARPSPLLIPEDAEEFLRHGKLFRYDLYRIPWNDGGGGTPQPLPGASANGRSNYFPKFSPDGRWIVFCQANSYMLLQPDSELYIMPAEGGTPRKMRCNTSCMNSWHSWSPNGRWLVFSSKLNGPYTQLWLTHVDAQGGDTPPVLLESFIVPNRAANIPEFVNCPPDAIARIRQAFLDDVSFVRAAIQLAAGGDLEAAAEAYRKALELNPASADAHYNLGLSLSAKGKHEEAMDCYRRAIRFQGDYAEAHNNLGALLLAKGELDQAETHLAAAVKHQPNNVAARHNLGQLKLHRNRPQQAIEQFRKALEIDGEYAVAHTSLGRVLLAQGNVREAIAHLEKAVTVGGGDPRAHGALGFALFRQGEHRRAVVHFEKAVQVDPNDLRSLSNLASLLATSPRAELRDGRRAVDLARKLCEATQWKNPMFLDTLAAAHAETGDFTEAVRLERGAIRLAETAGLKQAAETMRRRLSLYAQAKPYRLPQPPEGPGR